MGGARRYPFPKWVWTPYGGWWPHAPNSKRNVLIPIGISAAFYAGCMWYSPQVTTTYRRFENSVEFAPNDARSLQKDEWHQWKMQQHAKEQEQ